MDKYGLDLHCTMILEEYNELLPIFQKMQEVVENALRESIDSAGILVNALESRIKTEKSLAGKLELKGSKYATIDDLTDIVGARIITFYTDDVDKIAALCDRLFEVDWKNSIDKRKTHELNSFGYNSLHIICKIPKKMFSDPAMPQVNEIRFELQIRTALQHVWATMNHDTGYKSGVEVPYEYLRNLNRLAGMLELADEQFSSIRTDINNYRRKVQNLVASGDFSQVPLDGDSFSSYLKLEPFDKLTKRIAAINQAEISEASLMPYLNVFKHMEFKTLADVQSLIDNYSDDAYQFATYQLAGTDLDIISATISVQDLCVVYIMHLGAGVPGLVQMYNLLTGPTPYNQQRAERTYDTAMQLSFMNK